MKHPPAPTRIGNLDSSLVATVDARGLVTPAAGGWTLDWWIGADDRWHLPSQEPGTAVTQRLVDGAPVVETSMRVPGGHAVHRAWCVRDGGRELAVVEVENASRVPFAVALALRPNRAVTSAAIEGRVVVVNRRAAVVLPRVPSRVATSSGDDGDLADVVLSGAAGEGGDVAVRSRRRNAQLAVLHPLAHTAQVRVALPLGRVSRPDAAAVDLAALPDAERVARGWALHLDAALRVDLPDERLVDAVRACRASLLLGDVPRAEARLVAAALERWGHLPPGRRRLPATVALDGALAQLDAVLAAASRVWTWPAPDDRLAPATVLHLVRELLVAEDVERRHIALAAAAVADGWLGRGFEVHGAPTRWGRVSYAVRWHGARPALLWDVETADGTAPVRLTAPGLDPTWSSSEPAGEALLAPVEPPGGLPKVVAPLAGDGTPADAASDPGVSFS